MTVFALAIGALLGAEPGLCSARLDSLEAATRMLDSNLDGLLKADDELITCQHSRASDCLVERFTRDQARKALEFSRADVETSLGRVRRACDTLTPR